MKKSRKKSVLIIGGLIGAVWFGVSAGSESPAPRRDLTGEVLSIAEEVESRQVVDTVSLNKIGDNLGASCGKLAREYSDYSYALNMLKVASVLGQEVDLPDHAQRREVRNRIGSSFLDEGCPTGVMLQLIQRHKSVERYVDDALYALVNPDE